ncbi:hypothetical protein [Rhodococcus zopfii]|uniref:hypothetical protein n=1 Tax=Rhodococcus zopfii TaxID=43772 RepID=UPI0009352307|nr:hypothetical protein [Rhodococcus zopfii]
MTDEPLPDRATLARWPLSTRDIAKLTTCLVASTAAVVIGLTLLWDVVNPSKWTADGWAAAGGWFAGAGTVFAVVVALRQSQQARVDAEAARIDADRIHREQLREATLRADRATVVGLLPALRQFTAQMLESDFAFMAYDDERSKGKRPPKADSLPSDPTAFDTLKPHVDAVRSMLQDIQSAAFSVVTDDLHSVLEEAVRLVEWVGAQSHTWSMQAANGEELELATDFPGPEDAIRIWHGPFSRLAHHVEKLVTDALMQLPRTDFGPTQQDQADASITQ